MMTGGLFHHPNQAKKSEHQNLIVVEQNPNLSKKFY